MAERLIPMFMLFVIIVAAIIAARLLWDNAASIYKTANRLTLIGLVIAVAYVLLH
jgi:hypothetical protein